MSNQRMEVDFRVGNEYPFELVKEKTGSYLPSYHGAVTRIFLFLVDAEIYAEVVMHGYHTAKGSKDPRRYIRLTGEYLLGPPISERQEWIREEGFGTEFEALLKRREEAKQWTRYKEVEWELLQKKLDVQDAIADTGTWINQTRWRAKSWIEEQIDDLANKVSSLAVLAALGVAVWIEIDALIEK